MIFIARSHKDAADAQRNSPCTGGVSADDLRYNKRCINLRLMTLPDNGFAISCGQLHFLSGYVIAYEFCYGHDQYLGAPNCHASRTLTHVASSLPEKGVTRVELQIPTSHEAPCLDSGWWTTCHTPDTEHDLLTSMFHSNTQTPRLNLTLSFINKNYVFEYA